MKCRIFVKILIVHEVSLNVICEGQGWIYIILWKDEYRTGVCLGFCLIEMRSIMLLSQHHCRNCGDIFCNECSDNKMPLPSSAKPVRVCDNCHPLLLQRYSSTGNWEPSAVWSVSTMSECNGYHVVMTGPQDVQTLSATATHKSTTA